MATTVYTTEEVTLQDGKSVTLRPLNIKGLRKFMAKMQEFTKVENEDDGLDVLLDAAAICLLRERPDFWVEDKFEVDGKPVGGYSEAAEDSLDMPTVYTILDVCGGVKLNDPNLIAAATESLGMT